ncbi:KaiA domain protein [Synechococcus sp. PCC 7502]|uniref:circadian clock protein KaiA n=1 Tax=Synechococcus sp. PCC 7502 TaxID=1173263 RepID=UPI00029FEFEE|nr:circadian clock protein KaiA [Synechococcus sp. PCC 7502]AFY73210.1 KaiA domain protein [Synechococcus sp. PCC 7502]
MSPILQICCLLPQTSHHKFITQFLEADRFNVTSFYSIEQLSKNLIEEQSSQDCLIAWLEDEAIKHRLSNLGICLPTVLIISAHNFQEQNLQEQNLQELDQPELDQPEFIYPTAAAVSLEVDNLIELPDAIDQAIALFLKLPPRLPNQFNNSDSPESNQTKITHLATAQQRLSEKLQERLGYLGVYYKRDAKQFWRRLPKADQELYIQRLQTIYRSIILEYFKDNSKQLNILIDEFASMCFFADISVSQVLQIHMELMDDFAKQLRLEGRNEEILLDYRITLIDVIAHLCEMYRRSIPKEVQK